MMTANLLADETSPYLRQHRDNPVHWRSWGEAALDEAKRLNRPILLSVGYAACHWCHVMAHESFEDPQTAALMNELFINIKVDREERPDIDAIYQAALAMLGEQGGWPLTMFLTPGAEPFWGGTYFPPEARYGRPGFSDVLRQVSHLFCADPEKVGRNVEALRQGLAKLGAPPSGTGLSSALLDEAAATALRLIDPLRGGTAGAPKFPQPVFFRSLWRAWQRTRAPMFREAVLLTLDRLCRGGIYDHVGGGFARYATDVEWLVPHFEKMLYDNALLVELLTDVWLETRAPLLAHRVAETLDWMLDDLLVSHPDGSLALASARDADSEGEEGRYYVWTAAEIDTLLGEDAARFKHVYDVSASGNWDGHNILNLTRCANLDAVLTDEALAHGRAILRAARARRVAPIRDDKVLADWNGLAATALARAAVAFDRPDWLAAARGILAFAVRHMHAAGRLQHAWCDGRARHPAVLEDYANLARAAIACYEATGEGAFLEQARAWVATVDRHYWDGARSGYYVTADDTTDVIVRHKSIHDNAVPSGNGTMVDVLARLALHTGELAYQQRADRLVQLFSSDSPQYLVTVPGLLCAAELMIRPRHVVLAGAADDPAVDALRNAALGAAVPVIVTTATPGRSLPNDHPAAGKMPVDGEAAAYACIGQTCSLPLTDPGALSAALVAA